MKAYQVETINEKNDLVLVELPKPQPGFGQVLIKVKATALNYRDLIVLQGQYSGQKSPVIPMSDGAVALTWISTCPKLG